MDMLNLISKEDKDAIIGDLVDCLQRYNAALQPGSYPEIETLEDLDKALADKKIDEFVYLGIKERLEAT